MKIAVRYIYRTWAYLFARPRFSALNRVLYGMSLRGLGVLNYETEFLSGEVGWLKGYLSHHHAPVVFDVGANIGSYSRNVLLASPNATVYAFEPHPRTFARLQGEMRDRLQAYNMAVGETNSTISLYDYRINDGSTHASVYREVIEAVHHAEAIEHLVQVTTLDDFCAEHKIEKIDLLKIDTEGNELKCLTGARNMISSGRVRAIQFEFNEMNVISGSRFKDFWDLLQNYELYRLLPGGALLELQRYSPALCEVYAYQNIVALARGQEDERE